jgi:hypothetical protein
VLLVSSEIGERKRIFRRAHHSQVALNAGTQAHTRFGRALRNNRFYQRVCNEGFRDGLRVFRRYEKIDIVHNFLSPPITASNIDKQRIGMRGQIVAQRFGFRRDLPELK